MDTCSPSQYNADSTDCQRLYARNKNDNKRNWEIIRNEEFGRYVVATRDISPGEIIFKEDPLEIGPNNTNDVLCCVGCGRQIVDLRKSGCTKCDLPICNESCPQIERHENLECQFFAKSKNNFSFRTCNNEYKVSEIPYDAVMILRVLLMKERRPKDWEIFNILQASLDEWKNMPPWEENQQEKIDIIQNKLNLKHFDKEDILQVIARCCTNTFSKYLEPAEEAIVGTKVRAIFPMTSMLSHSCLPNVEQTISDMNNNIMLSMIAIREIKAGQQIFISYAELLYPTVIRQHNLLTNKLFLCRCERCSDPTEFGSNASGIKCSSCLKKCPDKVGMLLPVADNADIWQCVSCGAKFNSVTAHNLMFSLNQKAEMMLDNSRVTVNDLENMLIKFSKVLHPNHAILARIKYSLCGLYGRSIGYELQNLNEKQLLRKKALCEETLKVLDKLQPGYSCRRGMILYEYHTVLLVLGVTGRKESKKFLKNSLKYLRECLSILQLQSSSTFAGQLYQAVNSCAKDIENSIKNSLQNC